MAPALTSFRASGELPDVGLKRDAVLADAELVCLLQNRRGVEVSDLMVLFDELAVTHGEAHEAAVAAVQIGPRRLPTVRDAA